LVIEMLTSLGRKWQEKEDHTKEMLNVTPCPSWADWLYFKN